MSDFIYLASPYTPLDAEDFIEKLDIMEIRYRQVCEAAAHFIDEGYNVFSPIAHSHQIGKNLGNPTDSKFWTKLDLAFLPYCKEMWVLMLDDWARSTGIQNESREAEKLGKKIRYVSWSDLEILGGRECCARGI